MVYHSANRLFRFAGRGGYTLFLLGLNVLVRRSVGTFSSTVLRRADSIWRRIVGAALLEAGCSLRGLFDYQWAACLALPITAGQHLVG